VNGYPDGLDNPQEEGGYGEGLVGIGAAELPDRGVLKNPFWPLPSVNLALLLPMPFN
jgi:hypothetical protein